MSAVPSANRAADLYERHHRSVLRYCLSRLGREDAEDAAQTTFVHAVRGLRHGVVPDSEPAWLLGIARNVCLSRRERSARRRRLEEVLDPVELDRVARATDARREELIGVEDALRRLPERQRRAVLLRDWRGLSYDEVAAELGVSRAAVETLIFRGRDRLAGHLRDDVTPTRRRFVPVANAISFFSAARDALAGGAALVKLGAAAASVAVVAGSGVAIGDALDRGDAEPPHALRPAAARERPTPTPAPAAAAAPVPTRSPAAPARAAVPAPPARAERPAPVEPPAAVVPVTTSTPPPAHAEPPTSARPTAAPAAPAAPPTAPAAPDPEPAAPAPLAPVVDAVVAPVAETAETLTTAVDETTSAVTALVDETTAPVTSTVEETVSTAVAALPEAPVPPPLEDALP